jgi:signal transduction histidine kinase
MLWVGMLRRIRWYDWLLAVALGVVILLCSPKAAVGQVPPRHPLDWTADILMLVAALGVVPRRASALSGLAVATGACCAYLALEYPYGPILLSLGVPMFAMAAQSPIRDSAIACVLSAVTILTPELVRIVLNGSLGINALGLTGLVAWVVVPWALGTVKLARTQAGLMAREEKYRRRAYQERLHVAREVHDVVGHALATINMQSSVALHVLGKRPEQAKLSLEAIKTTSKESLDELRRTLDIFRQASEFESSERMVPQLPQIDALVSTMAASGLTTEVTVKGRVTELPASVNLAGYRILQESLTNVLRHSGSGDATVVIEFTPRELVLQVSDRGRARPGMPLRGGGNGITGMRHRASAVGGTLEAGPRPDGGFRVEALLPIGESG